ncbi:MAG: c-type cytochrome biogenesis protein CcsB [Deltaproteobacteria bacterium]|nr:c-type cytochrome biogenesis protein CcsB [Deltaproteobacteria bacterium]
MISTDIFFVAFIAYLISFFLYIIDLAKGDNGQKLGYKSSLIALIVHTIGLLFRYFEAGIVELRAHQESTGKIAVGFEKIKIMLSHPPFTNLYESMIFVLWGIAIVYLFINKRFNLNIVGLFGVALVVVGMGLSNLLPDKSITPLIPALKSWWLHIHVITASLAYGAFLLAAIISLLYLLKENVSISKIVITFLLTTAILILMVVSFNPLEYGATLMGETENGKFRPATISVMLETKGNLINIVIKKPAPLIGLISLLTIITSVGGAIILFLRKGFIKIITGAISSILLIYLLLLILSTSTQSIGLDKKELADLVNFSLNSQDINPALITNMSFKPHPPYKITLSSYPYQFSIILMLFMLSIFLFYLTFNYEAFNNRLPPSTKLDLISYRTILFAFPMMSFVIITGAVWAHYAWGRYWGWDPKETWSLITWLVYAFYLHSRHVLKWSGKRTAIIAVIGFAVVIFTYIGVNLGLTGSGLHVYGSK